MFSQFEKLKTWFWLTRLWLCLGCQWITLFTTLFTIFSEVKAGLGSPLLASQAGRKLIKPLYYDPIRPLITPNYPIMNDKLTLPLFFFHFCIVRSHNDCHDHGAHCSSLHRLHFLHYPRHEYLFTVFWKGDWEWPSQGSPPHHHPNNQHLTTITFIYFILLLSAWLI